LVSKSVEKMKKFSIILLITLISKWSFGQTYNMTSGTINTCSGTFYDSGGSSGNYSNNQNITQTFCSNNGAPIQFNFTLFDLRNGDFLSVYNGPNTSSPLIGTYEGNSGPSTITSSGTCITFVFISNANNVDPGWAASISCLSPPANDACSTAEPLAVSASTTCTTAESGTVEYATASGEAHGCVGSADDDVWYSFVATSTAHTVTLSGITGSTTDLDFAVYAASCGGTEILCSALVTNTASGLTPGVTYYVRVYTATATPGQTTDFNICITTPPAPPINDDPCGAIDLSIVASCGYTTYSNTNATATAGVPAPGCASYVTGDVWFRVQVPANGSIQIDTDDIGFSDGGMAAYSGTCAALTLMGCNDDSSPNGLMPLLSFTGLTPGNFIYIRVWEYGGNEFGNFGICVTSPTPPTPPTPPANNECSTATPATVNPNALCSDVVSGTISGATASAQSNTCSGAADDDVWYSFVASATTHTISLLNVNGSTTDLYHSVYAGTCGSIGAPLICSDPNSSTVTGLTIGNTYYVRIYSWTSFSGQNTTFDLCIGTPPPPPTNVTCDLMDPICSGSPIAFTAASNGGTAEPGNNYDCLYTQPNPSWYYLEISQAGNLVIDITAGSDVDYALWGPFADLATAQTECGTYGLPADCSYSSSAIEQAVLSGAQVGEVFILLVTNYANIVQTIFVNEAASNTARTDCSIVPLPVSLLAFDVTAQNDFNRVTWTTASERDNDFFIVQRSANGLVWETIGLVDGSGTTNEVHDYVFDDKTPLPGISYYRYKQVDFNGEFEFSPVASVERELSANFPDFYPVPTSEHFYIQLNLNEINALRVKDNLGREVSFDLEQIDNSTSRLTLKQADAGVYHTEIHLHSGKTFSKKIVVH
jgi:hypothetical protein